MMKKHLVVIPFLLLSLFAQSQVTKLFLDTNRNVTADSAKARFYFLVQKLDADSAYSGSIYNLRGDLLSVGTYKRADTNMPHGKFTFYGYHLEFNRDSSDFTVNQYVGSTGFYLNGLKSGRWNEYYFDGPRQFMYTYNNGKLNGAFEKYGVNENVAIRGNYLDNLKDGEWSIFAPNGKLLLTNVYKNNVLIIDAGFKQKKDRNETFFEYEFARIGTKPPHPEFNFNLFLNQCISKSIPYGVDGVVVVIISVDKAGKLSNPKIIRKLNDTVDNAIIAAILHSPDWLPAINQENKKKEAVNILSTITFVNSKATSNFFNGDEPFDPYF